MRSDGKEPESQNTFFQYWQQKVIQRFLNLNIRLKIIGPFLILTLIVAVLGTYVVTSLVFDSLDERLTNHAVEAGRVISSNLARQEITHQEAARLIAFTDGFAAAIKDSDAQTTADLALPHSFSSGVEWLLVTDIQGHVLLNHVMINGKLESTDFPLDGKSIPSVGDLLKASPSTFESIRGLMQYPDTDQYYYFTAVTVHDDDRLVGVVMLGTSLDTLLPSFKRNALADVTIYVEGGKAIASTLTAQVSSYEAEKQLLLKLSLPVDVYNERRNKPDLTRLDDIEIQDESYRRAIGALYIGEDALGVFSVAFPENYIFTAGEASRNSYFIIIFVAAIAVIAIGHVIAQRIIVPLQSLSGTALAVAEGDLERRTGIKGHDEIGVLAGTFDYMTESLAKRNAELQELLRVQQELASRMRAILSSIGDGVLFEDLNHKIEPANDAARAMLKTMSSNFTFGPIRELSAGKDWKNDFKIENPWLLESRRFQVADKVFSAHSAAVETDDKETLGTVIVLRDITAEVEAEQIKDAFVEHVSHELRTPLTSIKGYSSLLLATAGESLNTQQHTFLKTIVKQTENLTSMVNALLDFSEMQASGRLGIRAQTMDLAELITNLTDEWASQFEEKTLQFAVEIVPDVPPIFGDAKRLQWAFMNLIRNAHQYTPEGGKVTLKLSQRDGYVVVDVVDTGIGLSAENQRRIFNRFYRVMNVSDDMVRGLGLGLYVSKAIVEAHRGRISVVSQLDAGSTFTVELPIADLKEAEVEG